MNIYNLIEKQEWTKKKPSPRNDITTVELFKLCVSLRETKKVAEHLGLRPQTVSKWMNSYSELPTGKHMAGNRVAEFFGLKECTACGETKSLEDFYLLSLRPDSNRPRHSSVCKPCDKARGPEWFRKNPEQGRALQMLNYTKKKNRSASWANIDKIKEIYANCPPGYEVDHIIPLQGKLVSGLHVENNLQYLTISENRKKSNNYEIE